MVMKLYDEENTIVCVNILQRLAIQSFLRGSSVVVSIPISTRKILIVEDAVAFKIARGRRLFYTTPLKALSNQKFREFWYQALLRLRKLIKVNSFLLVSS